MEPVVCKLTAQNALSVGTNSNTVLFYIASSYMLYAYLHPFIEKTQISLLTHKQNFKIHVEILELNPVFQVQ